MAETLELPTESPRVLKEASAISYGDEEFCDYNWFFSLPLRDRAEWWVDMESAGIFPYTEFIEMTKEWFFENETTARSMIFTNVTAMMLDSGLEALEQ